VFVNGKSSQISEKFGGKARACPQMLNKAGKSCQGKTD